MYLPLYRQGHYNALGAIFKSNFLDENVWISIEISMNLVYNGPVDNTSASVQVIVWHDRRPAITWNNVDEYPWRHMVSPGLHELIPSNIISSIPFLSLI